jgi:hypothetical protein
VANILFSNNASALLAASIDADDTVIQTAAGFGALFPSPTGAQYFLATLESNTGAIEIVKCTSRTGDNLTVQRAQSGSTAQSFTLNITRVENRLTKGTMEQLAQINGASMTGDIDMNGNEIQDAELTGATIVTGGQTVGTAIRGALNISTNELAVPTNGTSRATAGGVSILVNTDDLIQYLDTAGVISFTSATIGVKIPGGAYFRVQDTSNNDYGQLTHDGTDFNFTFVGTAEVNWDTLLNITAGGIRLADLDLVRPIFLDFAVKKQTVSGVSSTTIDYTAGSYVVLNLTANITTLTLSNPPASHLGTLRIKVVQDATPRTIAWPASVKWPSAIAPVLSTGSGDIDFIDLWTDNGGTTWYGAYNTDWS